MSKDARMYADVVTWNPFVGCRFACTYCVPSFQAQAKRRRKHCQTCYEYTPHEHPERLTRIPSGDRTVFVCASGDINFCDPEYMEQVIAAIREDAEKKPERDYYLQSKQPEVFHQFLGDLPGRAILVTTLETNRDEGYEAVSSADWPAERHWQFGRLPWPRKVFTAEPLMDFDLEPFTAMLIDAGVANYAGNRTRPDHIWIGYNSRPKQVQLPEPPEWKVAALLEKLVGAGVDVRGKELRGLVVPEWQPTNGVCCGCGWAGAEEGPLCPAYGDDKHCPHWWDGPDPGAGSDHAYETAREAAAFRPPSRD